jgi:2-polyprenyl-3-methyl-5-hydroxy-6-metoxy-1,4-benzoquinol methylase
VTLDREKIWAFIDQLNQLNSATALIGVLAVADRSGLLAAWEPETWVTPTDLARGHFSERYVREIVHALASAKIVEHDEGRFLLPAEHAAVLVDPSSPYLMAGWLDLLPAVMKTVDAVAAVTVHGGGVPAASFDDRVVAAIDRSNSPSTRILLTRRWLAALPGLVAKLEKGGRIADIGCGSGAAAITMARAFPPATVIGYDVDPRAIERARLEASTANLPNVSFEQLPVEQIPDGFDLITAFDVIHDLPDPKAALERVCQALKPEGTFFMMEPKAGPNLTDNMNPYGSLLYGISVLYCLPQSLVGNGPGLGTAWGPVEAEKLCREAGFTHFRRLDIDSPFSAFYEVRP